MAARSGKKSKSAGKKTVAKPARMTFADLLAIWHEEILALLDDHYGELISRGRNYVNRVSGMKYIPGLQASFLPMPGESAQSLSRLHSLRRNFAG